ncbi:MAG TPA: divergent polysaccharide deacetylase family protein [Aliidongia sp.]|uniref:divergent polysaccharide deacetylase family protein n=1 Tax=Aliidongia sp. TaxID=1914230 RepID=UPI002DDCB297|nr:divergent polysaccharide deacetylase family protein [Aliidongia sp.]HEV2678517.1 divergent polysaccharide deacetylase family protein [Aliidongia sp.]
MAGKSKRRWQLWASAAALVVAAVLLALILLPPETLAPPRPEVKSASLPHPVETPLPQPDRRKGADALAPLIEQATADKPAETRTSEDNPEAAVPAAPQVASLPPQPPKAATVPVAPVVPALHGEPAWKQNAQPSGPPGAQPMIAIVIDDMGLDRKRSAEVMTLPGPLTLSFMTYAEDLAKQTATGRAHGDEIMLHMPMEPQARHVDPGPNALVTGLDDEELKRRVAWGLGRIDGIVGVNNHMGSKFTESQPGMTIVLEQLRERGLFFLDSRTTPHSVGLATARQMGVPSVGRDVFLDNFMTDPEVARELAQSEAVARKNGVAIAIGHPHDATIAELRQWLPTVAAKGFRLVPVSAIVAREQAQAAHVAKTGG